MNVLILYSQPTSSTFAYNDDWKDAWERYPGLTTTSLNLYQPGIFDLLRMGLNIKSFDLIVCLHSTNSNSLYIADHSLWLRALNRRKGKLVFFVGNEYKLMPEKISLIRSLGADVVASQLPQDVAQWLYAETKSPTHSVPHAVNPDIAKEPPPLQKDRPLDFSFRAPAHPLYLGQNRNEELMAIFSRPEFKAFKLDVSTKHQDRLGRLDWWHLLKRSRAVLSSETGARFLERDDASRKKINRHLEKFPKATFQDIYSQFFNNYPNPVSGFLVAPRHFEYAGCKTLQVMFPGRYNGIFRPNEHFISLEEDASNLDEVLRQFKDIEYCQKITDRTFEFVMENHTHAHRVKQVLGYL